MQAPLGVLRVLKSKCQNALKAVDESFQVTKNLFEKHNVVFTVGGGLLSAGAAWAGYTARQVHQKKLEAKLQKIEEHMTNVYSLEEQQVKALTTAAAKTGISYKTFFATTSTALIVGYALGFRGGRRFVIKRIPQELLLAAKRQTKDGKRSGLARLLPGRLVSSQPETSTPSQEAYQAEPALGFAAASSQFSGTSSMAQRTLNSAGSATEQSGSDSLDRRGDAEAASGSKSESIFGAEKEGRSSAVSSSESGSQSQESAQAVPSSAAVDLALGKTDIERQVDRALEPERKAAAEYSHKTDKILQATIPNLNGGWDSGREEADRALEDNMGTSLDFRESREGDVNGGATKGGAAASSKASEQDAVELGEKRYTESLEEEEHTIETQDSDRSLRK